MAPIPIDPDCIWNYSFCKSIDLGVEIDEDWYSVGYIEYDALDDLRGDLPQLFEEENVPINGWDEIIQETTEHRMKGVWTGGNILHPFDCFFFFGICFRISRTKFL
jgi:hypothetical protein